MTRQRTTEVSPDLVAFIQHAAEQPDIDTFAQALHVARRAMRLPDDQARETTRYDFLSGASDSDTKALVSVGDPAFLYGFACACVLLRRDGAR